MYNDVIDLISVTSEVNEYGDTVQTETVTEDILCRVKSASYKDKQQAGGEDFIPVYKVILSDYLNYSNQKYADYTDKWGVKYRYTVTDVYMSDNGTELELTLSRGIDQYANT